MVVHIRHLRQALEPAGLDGLLQTVRSVGYRFVRKLPVSQEPQRNAEAPRARATDIAAGPLVMAVKPVEITDAMLTSSSLGSASGSISSVGAPN